MREGNAEVVRRLYEGWARGDFAVAMEVYDPEVVFVIDYGPDRITATGVERMGEVWQEQLELWDWWSTGPIEKLIEEGDHVVVGHSLRGRSKRGMTLASNDAGAAFTFRDGRVVSVVATEAWAKALEAAGLSDP